MDVVSFGSAGLERAKWPRGRPFFFFSLPSLDFLARVTILRDCSQSINRFSMPKILRAGDLCVLYISGAAAPDISRGGGVLSVIVGGSVVVCY